MSKSFSSLLAVLKLGSNLADLLSQIVALLFQVCFYVLIHIFFLIPFLRLRMIADDLAECLGQFVFSLSIKISQYLDFVSHLLYRHLHLSVLFEESFSFTLQSSLFLIQLLSNLPTFSFLQSNQFFIDQLVLSHQILYAQLVLYFFFGQLLDYRTFFLMAVLHNCHILLHLIDNYSTLDEFHFDRLIFVIQQRFALKLVGMMDGELVGENVDLLNK